MHGTWSNLRVLKIDNTENIREGSLQALQVSYEPVWRILLAVASPGGLAYTTANGVNLVQQCYICLNLRSRPCPTLKTLCLQDTGHTSVRFSFGKLAYFPDVLVTMPVSRSELPR